MGSRALGVVVVLCLASCGPERAAPAATSAPDGYTAAMAVTDRERAHFAAIAQAKQAERVERVQESVADSPVRKMIEGLELGEAMPSSPEREALLDQRALGQAELQARARRLGLRD